MSFLLVVFAGVAIVVATLLTLQAGGIVCFPPCLSALLLYLFYFSLVAVTATRLLLVISAWYTLSAGGR
jgi:hypothetical protein